MYYRAQTRTGKLGSADLGVVGRGRDVSSTSSPVDVDVSSLLVCKSGKERKGKSVQLDGQC
jgi:hypothetical protein